MSQLPDPTIPFDASVVDEEALRALRAVQRNLPMGDGGASGNLVGGTEAVAAFGMVKGGPSGGIAVRPHEIASLEAGVAPAPEEEPLRTLDLAPPVRPSIILDQAQSGADALSLSAAATPLRTPRVATAQGASEDRPHEADASFVREISPAAADTPEEPQGPTPPVAEKPEPEEPADLSADAPIVISRDVAGLEDTGIGLDLSAMLADRDGSEMLTVSLIGVPAGAVLSHGTRQPDGSWSVPAADLAGLTLTPPKDFSGTIDLTLRATALEASGGSSTVVETRFRVQIEAVADAPSVIVADAGGSEDAPVSLAGLGGALRDVDGSEVLSFVLTGVPADATLSAGVRQSDGSWKLRPDQLPGLTLNPPANFSGSYSLTLTAVSTETSNGASARTSASFTVGIDPVVDAGTISGTSTGAEDSIIVIRPTFVTPDASESWSALSLVSGVPAGASLSQGREIAPGTWEVATTELQAGRVTVRPPEHSDADFTLTIKATLTDAGNGTSVSREVTGTQAVSVHAVADAPQVAAHNVAGPEDRPVALDLSAALVDTDGSEILSVVIGGLPKDALLSAGVNNNDGTWTLTPGQLSGLKLLPPADFSGRYDLTVTAVATESSTGAQARSSTGFTVGIDPVLDAATIGGSTSGSEDTGIALTPTFTLTDKDGSETWSAFSQVSGVPAGARLSQGEELSPGVWQVATAELQAGQILLHPKEDSDADVTLTIKTTLTDTGNGTSVSHEVTGTYTIAVNAVADAPQVEARNVAGLEDRPIALDLVAALVDTDGSEHLSVSILGVPEGFTLSAGTAHSGGEWRVPAASLHDLKLVPFPDWSGTLNLTVHATSTEASTGGSATTAKSFTVTIDPVNDAPELTLTAAEHADAGVHQADAFGTTHAEDLDSAQLGGAVITLSDAQPGDRLDLEGFTLHSENGRTMIGNTGIEVIGGAYADEAGTLTLRGHASPETYANVLQSLMLESGDQSGLAAGTRSIGVILFDSEGAASTQQSVDVVIDEVEPVQGEEQGFAATGFEAMQSGAGSDMILLMADGDSDMSHSVAGSWTEQIDSGDIAASSHDLGHLDQPTEHVQIIDDLQAEAARMSWS
jgi:large repetitive protein